MEDLIHQVEALLFSAGKKVSSEDLAKFTKSSVDKVNGIATQLQKDYDGKNSALMVISEGNGWKITVREKHLPLVQNIVAETELSKTIMETLAVIAWKAPVLQAEVIKIRTNKAYDHIAELEEAGFITRQKKGRTMLIKLADRFFNYFDLKGKDDIDKMFSDLNIPKQQTLAGSEEDELLPDINNSEKKEIQENDSANSESKKIEQNDMLESEQVPDQQDGQPKEPKDS